MTEDSRKGSWIIPCLWLDVSAWRVCHWCLGLGREGWKRQERVWLRVIGSQTSNVERHLNLGKINLDNSLGKRLHYPAIVSVPCTCVLQAPLLPWCDKILCTLWHSSFSITLSFSDQAMIFTQCVSWSIS